MDKIRYKQKIFIYYIDKMDNYSRRFNNMFPGIQQKENRFTRDLLAEGRTAAERNRRIRENENRREIEDNTLESLLNLIRIRETNIKTHQTKYFYPERDEKGNTIVDEVNKRIKFIEKETWDCIYRIFK